MGGDAEAERRPVVRLIGDIRLVPPERPGDCSCRFCSIFRGRHRWVRAAVALATVPLPFLVTAVVARDLEDTQGSGATVGGLLIAATLWTLLALSTWYEPLRRLSHRRRPRSTTWPPP